MCALHSHMLYYMMIWTALFHPLARTSGLGKAGLDSGWVGATGTVWLWALAAVAVPHGRNTRVVLSYMSEKQGGQLRTHTVLATSLVLCGNWRCRASSVLLSLSQVQAAQMMRAQPRKLCMTAAAIHAYMGCIGITSAAVSLWVTWQLFDCWYIYSVHGTGPAGSGPESGCGQIGLGCCATTPGISCVGCTARLQLLLLHKHALQLAWHRPACTSFLRGRLRRLCKRQTVVWVPVRPRSSCSQPKTLHVTVHSASEPRDYTRKTREPSTPNPQPHLHCSWWSQHCSQTSLPVPRMSWS